MNRIFRQTALDRLASPEQLDQLLQVTQPRAWIALATLGGIILSTLTWGIIGRIPERVQGRGILVRSGGVFEVAPTQGGRVSDLAVAVGDFVEAGQVIARVYQPDQIDRLQKAQGTVDAQRAEFERVRRYNDDNIRLQDSSLTQQIANLEQSVATSAQDLSWMEEKIATQTKLVAQGLMTKQTLIGTRQQYDGIVSKVRDARASILQHHADLIRLRSDARRQIATAQARVSDAERDLAAVKRDLKETSEVVSPYTGRILEVSAAQGELVRGGEPVVTLDLSGRAVKGLEAVVYVRSEDGKKLKPGMQIMIAPSTVKQEEYGFMVGRVTSVSDFPATARGMARLIKNDKLVSTLAAGDAPYQVHADLIPDPETTSQYRWTSSKGPPVSVESGTLCIGEIIVRERRPVDMVVPFLRKGTGL